MALFLILYNSVGGRLIWDQEDLGLNSLLVYYLRGKLRSSVSQGII